MSLDRLNVYIDGFNLYFGMRDAKLMRARWLDVVALAQDLAGERDLKHVYYYTARVKRPVQSNDRQAIYLDALEAKYPHLLTVRHGFMQWEPWGCSNCSHENERRQEKQTDVNLAVDVSVHAMRDDYDVAMVVSGDSDLKAAILAAQHPGGKRVVVGFPPERRSDQLADVASEGSFDISKSKVRKHQLPSTVLATDGRTVLTQPPEWLTDQVH